LWQANRFGWTSGEVMLGLPVVKINGQLA
jgi:hypothetical protein